MVNVARFVFNPFKENTYVVWDETNEGIIVDPGNVYQKETDSLVEFISAQAIRLRALIATHGHYDHVCGAATLQKLYNLPFAVSSLDEYVFSTAPFDGYRYQFQFNNGVVSIDLAAGEALRFGHSEIRPLPTPGHTLGGTSLYMPSSAIVFTGDTLLSGTVGRTDLKGSDHNMLVGSIATQLLKLPDNVDVYPGHGPQTTIGRERSDNEYLNGKTRLEDFC